MPHFQSSNRLVLVIISWCLCTIVGCKQNAPATEVVVINGEPFELELAITPEARENGLKHRENIVADGGMLFVFPESAVRSFWMHECLVDIDLMFLDSRGAVTAVHHMKSEPSKAEDESEDAYQQRLRSYSSVYPAQFAIELKAGWLDRLSLTVDEKIELDLSRLKAMAQ